MIEEEDFKNIYELGHEERKFEKWMEVDGWRRKRKK